MGRAKCLLIAEQRYKRHQIRSISRDSDCTSNPVLNRFELGRKDRAEEVCRNSTHFSTFLCFFFPFSVHASHIPPRSCTHQDVVACPIIESMEFRVAETTDEFVSSCCLVHPGANSSHVCRSSELQTRTPKNMFVLWKRRPQENRLQIQDCNMFKLRNGWSPESGVAKHEHTRD